MQRPLTHWLLLAALVVMWGSSFAMTRLALEALTPAQIVAGRNAIAALVLVVAVCLWRRRWPRGARLWGVMLLIALVGNALPFLLISWGQQRIDSGLAGILMAVMPLATLLLAHFLVPGERLTAPKLIGFLVGFGGILVLMGPAALGELKGGGEALIAQLAVLCAALCYAINTIISRHKPASDVYSTSAVVLAMAMGLSLPLALLGGSQGLVLPELALPDMALSPALALLGLGIVSTAAGSVVYFTLIAAAGPTFLSLINYLIPLWAVMVGALFMGERPEWNHLLALGLILAGVALSQRGARLSGAGRPG